jgi:hypothetical protein
MTINSALKTAFRRSSPTVSRTPEPMSSEIACLGGQSLPLSRLQREPRHGDIDALIASLPVITVEDERDAMLFAAYDSFEMACDRRHDLCAALLAMGGPANMIRLRS